MNWFTGSSLASSTPRSMWSFGASTSRSARVSLTPIFLSATARFVATVDFPVPPFPPLTAICKLSPPEIRVAELVISFVHTLITPCSSASSCRTSSRCTQALSTSPLSGASQQCSSLRLPSPETPQRRPRALDGLRLCSADPPQRYP